MAGKNISGTGLKHFSLLLIIAYFSRQINLVLKKTLNPGSFSYNQFQFFQYLRLCLPYSFVFHPKFEKIALDFPSRKREKLFCFCAVREFNFSDYGVSSVIIQDQKNFSR